MCAGGPVDRLFIAVGRDDGWDGATAGTLQPFIPCRGKGHRSGGLSAASGGRSLEKLALSCVDSQGRLPRGGVAIGREPFDQRFVAREASGANTGDAVPLCSGTLLACLSQGGFMFGREPRPFVGGALGSESAGAVRVVDGPLGHLLRQGRHGGSDRGQVSRRRWAGCDYR